MELNIAKQPKYQIEADKQEIGQDFWKEVNICDDLMSCDDLKNLGTGETGH